MGAVTSLFGSDNSEQTNTKTLGPEAQEAYNSYIKPYMGQSYNLASGLLGLANNMYGSNYGLQDQSSAINSYVNSGQQQIANAQNTYQNLINGQLPSEYQSNMENSIRSGVQNTLGSAINSLGNRGVVNSSVTSKANDDIAKSASNAMAQAYNTNINTVGNLASNQISAASAPISLIGTGQSTAVSPLSNSVSLANSVYGSGVTTPFSALAGSTGSGTVSNNSNDGLSNFLGTALAIGGKFIGA